MCMQELRAFLELPGELGANMRWVRLMPPSASIIEGTAKFSMQLIGRESKVVDPVAAAQPAARSKDLMRAMKEAAQGMRGGREVRRRQRVVCCRLAGASGGVPCADDG
jgi:hypothetical protein